MPRDPRTSSAFVVKKGDLYVAYPEQWLGSDRSEWTEHQKFAWRWCGTDSGNGARLTACRIGPEARIVRLVPKKRGVACPLEPAAPLTFDPLDEDPGECPICQKPWELVRPGKSQPTCDCQDEWEET